MNPRAVDIEVAATYDSWEVGGEVPRRQALLWRTRADHRGADRLPIHIDPRDDGVAV
jgi:hypothetical protein